MNAFDPITLFAPGDDANPGGGSIRDQLEHDSVTDALKFSKARPYNKITFPLSNGLDKPVNARLYGRSSTTDAAWHLLETRNLAARTENGTPVPTLDEITLTDWWFELKLTVQPSVAEDPTDGDFEAEGLVVYYQ